ncbi:MAG TPA: hypothetical protein VMM17_10835 [Gemmatimonadaceae bacterium]|nr:hypothetical protein [Gemmatimonadaceae bacterium]
MSKLVTFLAVAMLALGAAACASSSGPTSGTRSTRSPDLITKADIDAASTGTAYDLISRLRPQWLRATTVGSVSTGPAGERASAAGQVHGIVVYLDNVRLGGLESLRTISTGSINSVRYLDSQRAATTLADAAREPVSAAIMISTR